MGARWSSVKASSSDDDDQAQLRYRLRLAEMRLDDLQFAMDKREVATRVKLCEMEHDLRDAYDKIDNMAFLESAERRIRGGRRNASLPNHLDD